MRIREDKLPKDLKKKVFNNYVNIPDDYWFDWISSRIMLVLIITAIAIPGFIIWSWTTPSKIEMQHYTDECNAIAGNHPHFIARNTMTNNSMQCNTINSVLNQTVLQTI